MRRCYAWVVLLILTLSPVLVGSGAPENRLGHRMFYDPVREKVMLYGGANWDSGYTFYDDMWEFNYGDETWREVEMVNAPEGRFNAMVEYIPERHELFMYGGMTQQDRVSDTWILDLETMEWREIHTLDSPSPRSDASISYDPENNVMILFSGYRRDEVKTQQMWVFSFEEHNWVEVFPQNTPLHQYGHYMIYAMETGQHLMYPGHWSVVSGGVTSRHGYGGNIWEYKYQENEWVEIVASSKPAGRYWGNLAYDSNENKLILFGGHGPTEYDDTWSYEIDSGTWEKADSTDNPSKRSSSNMAYDPDNKVFTLFGGLEDTGSTSDTWILDAETMQWREVGSESLPVADQVENEQSSGIPSYPLLAVAMGLFLASNLLKSRNNWRKFWEEKQVRA